MDDAAIVGSYQELPYCREAEVRKFILISLLINVGVLVPVCIGLITNASWAQQAYGPSSPARGILLSVYMAICAVSLLLLFRRNPLMVAALLLVQVVYKVTTPFTVGTLKNPVVVSNLAIAALHSITLWLIWSHMQKWVG